MTAMFVVIFMEQWFKEKNHTSALLGWGCPCSAWGSSARTALILPAMAAILGVLTLLRSLWRGGRG